MTAKDIITGTIPCLTLSDRVEFAMQLMRSSMLTHLPVVREETFLGLVSLSECEAILEKEQSIAVSKLRLIAIFLMEDEHLYTALYEISTTRTDVLPVVDHEMRLVGCINSVTLPFHLAKFLRADTPGGVVVLEVNEKDYDLVEISQIVHSNDAKILSLSAVSTQDPNKIEITIKVNRIEIGPLLQSFFRFNYQVNASWSTQDAYHEGLHERFDALMNYLNI